MIIFQKKGIIKDLRKIRFMKLQYNAITQVKNLKMQNVQ